MVTIDITTQQQHNIKAICFTPEQSIHHTVIINAATGVKQHYYHPFAEYLARYGFHVYTYDYYGMGLSMTAPLASINASMTSWAETDMTAVIQFARQHHPENKISMIGHSLGGQLIGFTESTNILHRIVIVASQTPYWKHYHGFMGFKIWMLWHLMIPVLTPLFGYFPARKLGLFENLPKAAAYQWARWGRNKNYLFDEFPEKKKTFSTLHQKALVYSFADDPYATRKAVDDLLHFYSNLDAEHHHIHPSELKLKSFGHFSFFKVKYQEYFWPTIAEWLKQ